MRVYFVLVCVALCVISFGRSASSSIPKDSFYGISPEDLSYYKASSDSIKCKDGSNKFRKSRLNDDFCDCADGTDEPGTSACPTGKFYCQNIGHIPQTVFSSRVNDGICDCCDGSDEYDGVVKCRNTCWEAGKATRDRLQKKIATYQEGLMLRKKEVEQARIAYAKDESELKKLKPVEEKLKGLVQQLRERKEQIDELEDKIRLQKEEEEEEKREAQIETGEVEQIADNKDKFTESTHEDIVGNIDDNPSYEDLKAVNDDKEAAKVESSDYFELEGSPRNEIEEVEKYEDDSEAVPEINDGAESGEELHDVKEMANDVSENTGELSREELGRLVASRWTGDTHDGAKDESRESSEEMPKQTHDEDDDGYASDADDDATKYDAPGKHDYNGDDMDETYEEDSSSYKSEADDDIDLLDAYSTSLSNLSWLEKIQQSLRKILRPLNLFQTPVNISDAARVRKEYDEFSNKLTKMASRISTLSEKLKHDFGPEKEFYSFYDRCFETKQNKYVYKVCPYKQATQEEGYTRTRLGNWEKFEDSYRAMIFSDGDKCWNGPNRSLKVRLRCGLSNEITDVDEPSRCEYVAILSTPAVCTEDKLKELQNKLDLLNNQQPEKHDEL